MYFAVEATHPDLPAQLVQALEDLRRAEGEKPLHVFALIDGVFDETLLTRRPWSLLPKRSLYEETRLQEFDNAAPHLLVLPSDAREQTDWVKRLVDACSGKPMLSFMASVLPADSIRSHFGPYLIARTKDGTEWPIRWGDTRVLPGLIDALDATQRAHLLSPLHRWWSIDRKGWLVAWSGPADVATPPAAFDTLPITDAAFSRLVDQGEADAILANIHDVQPDVVRQHSPAECHVRLTKHLLIADQYGIIAAGARQHFCTLSLVLADDFTRHPAMMALLKHTHQGNDYATEVKALPRDFWQEAA